MKVLTSSVLALALSVSTAMAADVGALPAGHPAGVKNAQMGSETLLFVGLGVAAAVGIALAVSSSDSAAGPVVSNTVISPSTTS